MRQEEQIHQLREVVSRQAAATPMVQPPVSPVSAQEQATGAGVTTAPPAVGAAQAGTTVSVASGTSTPIGLAVGAEQN